MKKFFSGDFWNETINWLATFTFHRWKEKARCRCSISRIGKHSVPFSPHTTAMEDPHVCCIPTQKNTRVLSRSRYIDILTEKFREVLCSISLRKLILECLAKRFSCSTCCFHTSVKHALVIRVCFREISLIGTFQLKPVLTSGNLGYKTWIACPTVKHKTRSSIVGGLTSRRAKRYEFPQSPSATSIICCWQNSILILKRGLIACGMQQISSILINSTLSSEMSVAADLHCSSTSLNNVTRNQLKVGEIVRWWWCWWWRVRGNWGAGGERWKQQLGVREAFSSPLSSEFRPCWVTNARKRSRGSTLS